MIQAALLETQRAPPTHPRGETGWGGQALLACFRDLGKVHFYFPALYSCLVGYIQLMHRVLPPHPRWLQPLRVQREIQTLNLPIFNLPQSVVSSEFLLRRCPALHSFGCQWPSTEQGQSSTGGPQSSYNSKHSRLPHQDHRACPESLCAPTSCWDPCRGGRWRYLPRCSAGGAAGWGGTAPRGSSAGWSGQGCAGARG